MFKNIRNISFLFILVVFTGCTHKMNITPDVSNLDNVINNDKVKDYNVGYYLSSFDKDKYVVTPGGGGDKVGYYLYKDFEIGFRTILLNNFNKVYKVKTLNDDIYIKEKGLKYIFTYNLESTSSSDSLLTWPPTKFTISLTSSAYDKKGNKVWEDNVVGTGNASFSEFKSDFSLSGKLASENALRKMLEKINNTNKF